MAFTCTHCTKEFDSEEALTQHKTAKHAQPTPAIKINRKHVVYCVLLLLVIGFGYFLYVNATAPGKYDDVAKCITENGATFYGAFWCSACAKEKQILGKSLKYIDYQECSLPDKRQNQMCNDLNISGYPTWIFADGSRVKAVLTIEALATKTGCSLPK